MKQVIIGTIIGCTKVQQYTKKNGETGVKCVLHIQGVDNGEERPQEVAVSVTGDLSQWAGSTGMKVECEYVNRVFTFNRNGEQWYGNDVYGINIKSI